MGEILPVTITRAAALAIISDRVQANGNIEHLVIQCVLHFPDPLLAGFVCAHHCAHLLDRQEEYLPTL